MDVPTSKWSEILKLNGDSRMNRKQERIQELKNRIDFLAVAYNERELTSEEKAEAQIISKELDRLEEV